MIRLYRHRVSLRIRVQVHAIICVGIDRIGFGVVGRTSGEFVVAMIYRYVPGLPLGRVFPIALASASLCVRVCGIAGGLRAGKLDGAGSLTPC